MLNRTAKGTVLQYVNYSEMHIKMTLIFSTSLQLSVRRVGDLLLGVGAHAHEVGDNLHGVHQALRRKVIGLIK